MTPDKTADYIKGESLVKLLRYRRWTRSPFSDLEKKVIALKYVCKWRRGRIMDFMNITYYRYRRTIRKAREFMYGN